jgi:hypothetical protein
MVDRNVFSPFARDFSDGRINPLVHLCKLAPAVGFEPTIRLRRINSQVCLEPRPALSRFESFLPRERSGSRRHFLGIDKFPRSTKSFGCSGQRMCWVIVLL